MATHEEIPTDIALEIADDLEPRRFLSAVKEFFGLTEELGNLPGQPGKNWRVKVREGSNIIAIASSQTADANVHLAAVNRMQAGAQALVEGDFSSPLLTDKAIRHAKRLSDLTKDGPHVTAMRLWLARRPIQYGPDIADLVRQNEAASYSDYGTLEGTLRAITDQNGSLEIRIQDPLWSRAIRCRVTDEQIDEAMSAFRKRVEVAGVIHYNRLGRPTSIRMENLTTLPDDSELPTAADIRGLFSSDA